MKMLVEVKEIESFFVKPRLQEPGDELSMDWSKDIPEVQFSSTSYISPAEENISSPHTLLHKWMQEGRKGQS